jgi:16S rRNA (guanine966-N2)-methyltransferase
MPGSDNKKARPGRLRIVAGNWRSRLLDITDSPGLRPTSERIRETLFNWIAPGIGGARCLDLFAGTGALGFEALSRGAAQVVFVEKSRRAAKLIEGNIEALQATGATVICADAMRYLRTAGPASFDVIFLDPPFADDLLEDLCRLIDELGLLAPGGRVYLEQDRSKPEPALPGGWTTTRNKTAGQVRYSLVEAGKQPN